MSGGESSVTTPWARYADLTAFGVQRLVPADVGGRRLVQVRPQFIFIGEVELEPMRLEREQVGQLYQATELGAVQWQVGLQPVVCRVVSVGPCGDRDVVPDWVSVGDVLCDVCV